MGRCLLTHSTEAIWQLMLVACPAGSACPASGFAAENVRHGMAAAHRLQPSSGACSRRGTLAAGGPDPQPCPASPAPPEGCALRLHWLLPPVCMQGMRTGPACALHTPAHPCTCTCTLVGAAVIGTCQCCKRPQQAANNRCTYKALCRQAVEEKQNRSSAAADRRPAACAEQPVGRAAERLPSAAATRLRGQITACPHARARS